MVKIMVEQKLFFDKTIAHDRQLIVILKWNVISTNNMFPSIKIQANIYKDE